MCDGTYAHARTQVLTGATGEEVGTGFAGVNAQSRHLLSNAGVVRG